MLKALCCLKVVKYLLFVWIVPSTCVPMYTDTLSFIVGFQAPAAGAISSAYFLANREFHLSLNAERSIGACIGFVRVLEFLQIIGMELQIVTWCVFNIITRFGPNAFCSKAICTLGIKKKLSSHCSSLSGALMAGVAMMLPQHQWWQLTTGVGGALQCPVRHQHERYTPTAHTEGL